MVTAVKRALRHDQAVVIAALAAVTALAWAWLLAGAGMDMTMPGHAMAGMRPDPWSPGELAALFAMWSVMMAAMMLPSAAPMILLFATIQQRRGEGKPRIAVGLFVLGYLAVWLGFSAAAMALQAALQQWALLSPMIASTSAWLSGLVLIGAGIYQLTPLKQACLRHCRGPLDFVLHRWRPGGAGAFAMGLEHGAFCLGCCWVLMLLLFVGGVMNLVWIALITLFVLIEKTAPATHWTSRAAALGLVLWGGAVLLRLPGA